MLRSGGRNNLHGFAFCKASPYYQALKQSTDSLSLKSFHDFPFIYPRKIPEMSDLHTFGSTFDTLPSAEVGLQIPHIVADINKTKLEALKLGHLQMLEDLGRKGALLEVHDRLSGLNSWDKDSPAPQNQNHAFIKQVYWSLLEEERQTRTIIRDQELGYEDALIEQGKHLEQHYESELENQERKVSSLKDKHKLSESLHEKEIRVLSEDNSALKEDRYKLEIQLADVVVLSEDVRFLRDGLEEMKQNHDNSLVLAHRHAKSNETLKKKQNDLGTQISDHHVALNAIRKEFSKLLSEIPAQVNYRDEHIQALERKLMQMETKLNQLSTNDRQQSSFNKTLVEKQKLTSQLIEDHATRFHVFEQALANLEDAERDQRREYSALSGTNATGIEVLGKAVKILESNQLSRVAELEEEIEDTVVTMRRLNHRFNLLLLYLFLLVFSSLICAVGFWPVRGLPYRGR